MSRVSVNNISKQFKIYNRPQDRLLELLIRKPRHNVFHVLNDISFALEDGKSLGIVGINGHRSIGGYRASIYNALNIDSIKFLIDIMQKLEKNNT